MFEHLPRKFIFDSTYDAFLLFVIFVICFCVQLFFPINTPFLSSRKSPTINIMKKYLSIVETPRWQEEIFDEKKIKIPKL